MSIGYNIFQAGEDAFKNLFVVSIENPNLFNEVFQKRGSVIIRATSFNIPSKEIDKYEIWTPYGKFYRSSKTDVSEKYTSFSFRIDKNWVSYNQLLTYFEYFSNKTNLDDSTTSNGRFIISVHALPDGDENKFSRLSWIFNDCFIYSLSEIDLSYSVNEPVEITIGFCYNKLTYN